MKERGITNVNFQDSEAMAHISNVDKDNHVLIHRYLQILAVCHTVIAENKKGQVVYNASSPDELALVNAAKYFGYEFLGRDKDDNMLLQVEGEATPRKYELLNVIEFTSARKRMTIIVRTEDNKIKVMCKGADTMILARLNNANKQLVEQTQSYLEAFSKEGLRTLVLAEKDVSEEVYEEWNMSY